MAVAQHINLSWSVPPRANREELIDSLDHSIEDFRQSFRDLRRINKLLGGTSLVLRRLSELLNRTKEPITVLDVGTGSADIPRALLRWARKQGRKLRVTAVDANPKVLGLAQTEGRQDPDLDFVLCDATVLPFESDSFDYVLSSLTFHHFDDETAIRALREMDRVAKRASIVNDLRRGYLPAALIWLITRVFRMNRLTRHDAPLSVLRSRTMGEYRELAKRAGLTAVVYKHAFWRAVLVGRKDG